MQKNGLLALLILFRTAFAGNCGSHTTVDPIEHKKTVFPLSLEAKPFSAKTTNSLTPTHTPQSISPINSLSSKKSIPKLELPVFIRQDSTLKDSPSEKRLSPEMRACLASFRIQKAKDVFNHTPRPHTLSHR